jgi:hypothetical protein
MAKGAPHQRRGAGEITRRRVVVKILIAGAFVLAFTTAGFALPTPQVSLASCQKAVRAEALKYIKKRTSAIATCLNKMADEKLRKNNLDAVAAANAAKTCASELRKVNPLYSGSLEIRKISKLNSKCLPGAKVTHTDGDVTGIGATVAQPLQAINLNAHCAHFGGDGGVDTSTEWFACLDMLHDCASNLSISVQYPRAIEWLNVVRPAIVALPPSTKDPNKYTEAVAGLDAVKNALDGAVVDGVPDFQCGSP